MVASASEGGIQMDQGYCLLGEISCLVTHQHSTFCLTDGMMLHQWGQLKGNLPELMEKLVHLGQCWIWFKSFYQSGFVCFILIATLMLQDVHASALTSCFHVCRLNVTCWPKYCCNKKINKIRYGAFENLCLSYGAFGIILFHLLLDFFITPDLLPHPMAFPRVLPAGWFHWHVFANNPLATLITQSSPVQIFPNVFISEVNHWKLRGISYSCQP